MKSMTAYGESAVDTDIGKVSVEIRSENHRFLDLKINTSESLYNLESIISELVSKNIVRGKLRLKLSLIENTKNSIIKNENILKENYNLLKKAKKEVGIKDEIKLEHILQFKELTNYEYNVELSKENKKKILSTVEKAIKKFIANREVEGKKLKKDISSRIKFIKNTLSEIKKKRSNFSKEATEKIVERIEKLIKEAEVDQQRLIQEVAFLTERSDISEELVRLDAHITKFNKTSNESGSIGKELDFLIQEMNRECGTISAKCKDADISHLTIALRSELEKIREQIQNIE